MICQSCHSEHCEPLSVLHERSKAAAPYAAPPQRVRGADALGVGSAAMLLASVLHSGWWLGGTAVLGLAALSLRAAERRHHAQALTTWLRSCLCMDCGASWQHCARPPAES